LSSSGTPSVRPAASTSPARRRGSDPGGNGAGTVERDRARKDA
jgi:hypothetical protein